MVDVEESNKIVHRVVLNQPSVNVASFRKRLMRATPLVESRNATPGCVFDSVVRAEPLQLGIVGLI